MRTRACVHDVYSKVEGAHVLVRRGGCSFFAKALSVSNSGGLSLVVIDEGAGRLRMEANEEETVEIPVVMVSKVEGERNAPQKSRRGGGRSAPSTSFLPSAA